MNITSRRFRLRAVWLLVVPFYWFADPTPGLLAAGAAISGVGAAIRAWAAGHLRKEEILTVTGPYAFTRNPLYVGSFLIGAGVTVAGGQPVFLALFAAFFLVVYRGTAFHEERVLEAAFGDDFRRYAEAVPLFLPRRAPYRPKHESRAEHSVRFTGRRYMANREWEASTGIVVAMGLLALKMWLGW